MKTCKCGGRAEYLRRAKRWLCEACALARGFLVKCNGEAHSNPFIDNCMVCMPRWGVHEIRNVADFDRAIAKAEADLDGDRAFCGDRYPWELPDVTVRALARSAWEIEGLRAARELRAAMK